MIRRLIQKLNILVLILSAAGPLPGLHQAPAHADGAVE